MTSVIRPNNALQARSHKPKGMMKKRIHFAAQLRYRVTANLAPAVTDFYVAVSFVVALAITAVRANTSDRCTRLLVGHIPTLHQGALGTSRTNNENFVTKISML